MQELLKKYEFNYSGSCHCSGYYTLKYRRESFMIKVRPKSEKFAVYQYDGMIDRWQHIGEKGIELENRLKQINVSVTLSKAAVKTKA